MRKKKSKPSLDLKKHNGKNADSGLELESINAKMLYNITIVPTYRTKDVIAVLKISKAASPLLLINKLTSMKSIN